MSKQTNEQDEQKVPSGESQGGKGREASAADKSGAGSGKNRSRQRGKSSQQGGGDKPQSAPPTPSGSTSETAAAAKPDDAKPTEGKPAGSENKPVAGKPGESQPAASEKPPASGGTESAKPAASDKAAADTPKQASSDTPKGETPADTSKQQAPDKPKAAASGGGQGTPPPAAAAHGSGKGGGKGGGKMGGLALVLVLVLAIAAGMFALQAWQRLDAQQQRLAELETRTADAATAASLSELESRLEERLAAGEDERDAEMAAALEAMQSEFASYRGEVDTALDQVLDELSREQQADEREWLHAEAAYLLRLANQRLQLERDVEGAAALLRTADARLSEAENPALLSIRRAIASELAILESVPQVDRTGLYLALNAQQERLAALPLSRELEEIPARSGIEEVPAGGWQQQLSRFGQELRDLVVIRHHDEALEGLISPEQESYLRQSARLVLEQAQLALLKEEQDLYEASLDKALTLIHGYYDTERDEVQSVIARLESLKAETIRPELPDISGSQQALATFIERRFGSRGEQGDDA
ncbi:hypothetical protein HOP52_01990 [Halomonas campisalis]|uniref:Uroporphyrin-3 C-methyltransferase n=1 Tax=Billgrantia campisalis TaxID=74661 RepID=A0ABS9P4M4_9GAMM|nr:uroporphyrinogen-III C-methyltransferase [Halomonas campisalis]MCG6656546.1 hypothetical protein [Halomonas campisalis]MDR5861732.1 uroporphyrinogen-III C-methyltransferase [Halomonas campisalis]